MIGMRLETVNLGPNVFTQSLWRSLWIMNNRAQISIMVRAIRLDSGKNHYKKVEIVLAEHSSRLWDAAIAEPIEEQRHIVWWAIFL